MLVVVGFQLVQNAAYYSLFILTALNFGHIPYIHLTQIRCLFYLNFILYIVFMLLILGNFLLLLYLVSNILSSLIGCF